MDVNQASKKWGISASTLRKYCADGIIPPAEKEGRRSKWSIPDEWPRPPMGRHRLCYLLDTIYQLNSGVNYNALKWGVSDGDVIAGFDYLMSAAFMSTIDAGNLARELRHATVTPRGQQLIEADNRANSGKTHYRTHVNAEVGIGPAKVNVGGEISNG
ncbi:MAG: helix-turn-helix domain-containing protein [Collinsella aerofaciens]|jgi:hypothetical protein|nr:helix-turn-helix domain-containing protein [Collinsella aerofaciens]